MESSNLTFLKEGVYELEKGDGERLPSSMGIARLKYGETSLLQKFSENAYNLPSGLEENVLEIVSVTHDGSYADGEGQRKFFPEVAFGCLKEMTFGQKVLILEMKDEMGEEGEKEVRMYVIKLLEYLQLEIPTPTKACLGMHLDLRATINSSKTTLNGVVVFARLVDEDDKIIGGNTLSQFMENVHVTGRYDLAYYFHFKIPILRLGTVRVRLVFVQLMKSDFALELRVLGYADSAQILVQDNGNPKITAD